MPITKLMISTQLHIFFLSGDTFVLEGITVNKTNNGGDIFEQAAEAERVIKLCGMDDRISVSLGATASFLDIESNVDQQKFDGVDAVDLMIKRAHRQASDPLRFSRLVN